MGRERLTAEFLVQPTLQEHAVRPSVFAGEGNSTLWRQQSWHPAELPTKKRPQARKGALYFPSRGVLEPGP